MAKPRIMFYHDGRHPLIYMYEPPMQKEEYESAVDELVGTSIQALMFCLGDGRTVLHDTKVGELWGTPNDRWDQQIFRRAYQNAKHLIEEGNDPLRVVCDRAHARGLLLYPTLLVNQGSGERGEDTRGSIFRFTHKHMDIGAKGGLDPSTQQAQCADFMYDEMRQERLDLIKETVTRYSVDGFELQLNYQPYYFHPTEIVKGRPIMTRWVKQVHDIVKASGAERELVIRIPAKISDCLAIGLDPKDWVKKGIVDVLVGETYPLTEQVEQQEDFRDLVTITKGTDTRVHAAIHHQVHSDRIPESPIEVVRATACNYWAQGIDGIYMAYWSQTWPRDSTFYEKVHEIGHPDIMDPKDKYYFVTTTSPSNPPDMKTPLPIDLHLGKPVSVQFNITDDLAHWGAVGRVHEVLLRLRIVNNTEIDRLNFKFNGKPLPESLLRKINQMYRMSAPRYRVNQCYWYIFKLDKEHWPVKGTNRVEVLLEHRDDVITPQIALRDVELEIKYLKGKNYHRSFVDPDLGFWEGKVT